MPRRLNVTRQTSDMADFHVYRDRLEIRLTRAEKLLSLRRDDIVVPRDNIRSVAITADPWIWIRGVRAPGNSIPLTLAVGTWKFHGGKDFLVLKGKQRSAVVIDIEQPDARGSEDPSGDESASSDAATPAPSSPPEVAADALAGGSGALPGAAESLPGSGEVADGFSRVIVSTQHAAELVEALREIHPGSDGPADEVIS
ncbi:hypothetical protein GCM10027414_24380 [Humibacter ginsengiterrae]